MPRCKSAVGDRVGVVGRHVEEVRVRLERREAERAQSVGEALALLEDGRRVGARRERRDSECCADSDEIGAGAWRAFSSAATSVDASA